MCFKVRSLYENHDFNIATTIKEVDMLTNSPCFAIAFGATMRKTIIIWK